MAKFKKGDRVKVIAYPDCISKKGLMGQVGTVIEKPSPEALKGEDFIRVKLDHMLDEYWFYEDELEKIKEEN